MMKAFQLLFASSLVVSSVAGACPFCSAPSLTLSEQLHQSRIAVVAEWVSAIAPDSEHVAGTTFEIRTILVAAADPADVPAAGERVELDSYRLGEPGDLFLLLANAPSEATEATPTFADEIFPETIPITPTVDEGELDWLAPIDISAAMAEYLQALPKYDAPSVERLAFFVNYLEHDDAGVSSDAYGEFASASYDDVRAIEDVMPRDQLRQWITSPETTPTRLGLYGLMLGLCGEPADKALMEKKITETTGEFRLGIDGVIGGYLLLAGEPGLELIEQTKLSDTSVPFSETYAAMQALRFLWIDGGFGAETPADAEPLFTQERLRQSMRLLLKRPELVDLVIADLARWGDWSQVDEIYELYDAEGYEVPSVKRAIVRFMLAATKVKTDRPTPEQIDQAQKYLEELEGKDPKTVEAAKRFFFLQSNAKPSCPKTILFHRLQCACRPRSGC